MSLSESKMAQVILVFGSLPIKLDSPKVLMGPAANWRVGKASNIPFPLPFPKN